jgi:hypothetical protein
MANPTGKGGFKPGNQHRKGKPGGPGRPRREVEREYLEAFKSEVPPERWGKIIGRAATDAENGDGVARAWLSKHLVGDDPLELIKLRESNAELAARLKELEDAKASVPDGVGDSGGNPPEDRLPRILPGPSVGPPP